MKHLSTKTGFTLVELLIAISILSLSILAAFTAVSNNLKGTNFSQDQVEAYYLADEGIEFIRNLRDENGIKNIQAFGASTTQVSWLAGIADAPSDPCYGSKVCIVDSPLKTLTACSGVAESCPFLRMDSATGLFGYTGSWDVTGFRRSIVVSVVSPSEATISVTVSWTTNGIAKNYTESETIRAWQ